MRAGARGLRWSPVWWIAAGGFLMLSGSRACLNFLGWGGPRVALLRRATLGFRTAFPLGNMSVGGDLVTMGLFGNF